MLNGTGEMGMPGQSRVRVPAGVRRSGLLGGGELGSPSLALPRSWIQTQALLWHPSFPACCCCLGPQHPGARVPPGQALRHVFPLQHERTCASSQDLRGCCRSLPPPPSQLERRALARCKPRASEGASRRPLPKHREAGSPAQGHPAPQETESRVWSPGHASVERLERRLRPPGPSKATGKVQSRP